VVDLFQESGPPTADVLAVRGGDVGLAGDETPGVPGDERVVRGAPCRRAR